MNTLTRIQDRAAIKSFVLAGNALFTLKSNSTGDHFTYKVVRRTRWNEVTQSVEWVSPPAYLVKVLTGRDNSKDYRVFGHIAGEQFIYLSRQGPVPIGRDALSVKAFRWFWRTLTEGTGEKLSQVEMCHAGFCGRCGRLLTVPESIKNGIGPECADRIALEAMGGAQGLLDQLGV